MAKNRTEFVCQSCGHASAKWHGKCPVCNDWNTLVEEKTAAVPTTPYQQNRKLLDLGDDEARQKPRAIMELTTFEGPRLKTGMDEFDRVLGGGCVPGSVVLLGGDPGIGKSTLLLDALNGFAKKGLSTLYVSGEESGRQIRLRAERLNARSEKLLVLTETSLEAVLQHIAVQAESEPFQVIGIDSIQTLFSEQMDSAAGSVGQLRTVTATLIELAKKHHCICFLIGHVTKDGSIAGPRVLEHMVDTVLYFEGNHASDAGNAQPYRILRSTKNRFGSTNEMGVFEMTHEGLRQIANPSEYFLSERVQDAPGSAITVTLEGTRPFLLEVQCLTLPCYGGSPRRTCIGIDGNRVSLMAAVIQRELDISLYDQDLYLNIAGGLKISEPAADLGVVASIISSRLQRITDNVSVFMGEVGLTGEIRAVQQPELRLQEAAKLGFQHVFLPKTNLKQLKKIGGAFPKVEIFPLAHISELVEFLQARPVKNKTGEKVSPLRGLVGNV